MDNPLISIKTRNEFREYFVGTTLREITEAFDAGGVRCDLAYTPNTNGERRSLVEQYYHTVDWSDWRSVSRVVKVYENELRELFAPAVAVPWTTPSTIAFRTKTAEKLLYWLKQDGFEWVNNSLVRSVGTPGLEDLSSATHKLEGTHLTQQIQRMKDSVESDPALAIGTAKELIETVCKTMSMPK